MAINRPHIAIIGGGFGGLAAAWELSRNGMRVTVLEQDDDVGGLAGSFRVNGYPLEKFYHHWFTNDRHVMELARELDIGERIVYQATRTGMYLANKFHRLSTPLDVLRFKPLNPLNRFRLGLLMLKARRIRDWRELEHLTAEEWLIGIVGREVYEIVWEPLLRGKFGKHAGELSAVWMWSKLVLRGGSRGRGGKEMLAYFQGGFASLARIIASHINSGGGCIRTNTRVSGLAVHDGRVTGLIIGNEVLNADAVIATPALPIIADIVEPHVTAGYLRQLRAIEYLANVCLVLELDRSLSETYWLNVNDPSFPFVGIVEHTNFQPVEAYDGRHIVYLSKYLPASDPLYQMGAEELYAFAVPHIRRMFPDFDRSWVHDYHVWSARYSQPVIVRNYARLIPDMRAPIDGLFIASMAQVYPEDRGTNYAIRDGRKVARALLADLHRD